MNIWTKLFTRLHRFIYRLTHGYLGNLVVRRLVLLLHTVGRRTGKHRTTTLSYYRDGNSFLVVASNWGEESQPDWYHNLVKNPCTTIQVKDKQLRVKASLLQDEEYRRLWLLVTPKNDQYIQYQKGIKWQIPIVILTPVVTPIDCE
jgi:deazaflavin-dependent oxidoreductase (nitroreductase family)